MRAIIVLKDLRYERKFIKDKETKKKYDDAVYAVYQGLKIINKIYKNRKMVNERLLKGVKNIVNESEELPIIIMKI
jgi:fructose-1,6-bisphosphatase